jgi:hypothetical protein
MHKTKPTQPGYYWWRLIPQERPMILIVNFEGWIYSLGEETGTYLKDVINKVNGLDG